MELTGLLLFERSLSLANRGRRAAEIRLRGFLLLHRHFIVLLGFVARVLRDQATRKHGLCPFHVALEKRHIGPCRIHFEAFVIRL
jgi:hypothetical protein